MIDKLYLELSQFTKSKTAREIVLEEILRRVKSILIEISMKAHGTGYDWNADESSLTKLEGDTISMIDKVLCAKNEPPVIITMCDCK